jgi:lipopolysaccharide transport system permease protein
LETQPALIDRAARRHTLIGSLVAILAYRELVRNLVVKDLKLKYRGSVLGFLWSLVNPLAMIGIYTLAFKYILGVRQPGFPFFILLGLLAWSFFANSAVMSTGALVEGGSLVKAVRFPRAVLPLATVLFNLVQYLLTIVALLPLMFLAYRVPPAGPMLLFPVFLALQIAFIVGIALMLAAATAFFRDVRHFVDIGLALLFWTTPIVYPLSQAPEWLRPMLLLSPMSPFVVAYQRIFYYGEWPDGAVWAAAAAYGLGVFTLGTMWFLSLEDRIGEQL